MKKCPKCGNKRFLVTAHIVQGWEVDEFGEFQRVTEDCVCVTHYPDNEDLWTCLECGYEDSGDKFKYKDE